MTDLTRFAQQLALWSREVIDCGRSPFRRVDLYPDLLTRQGEEQPPLVFWINRQSLQAGGVLVLPDCDDVPPADGLACAHALGLKHAVAWTPRAISLWEETDEGPVRQRHTPVAQGSAALEDFRQALENLLAELKVLAVTGLRPPRELPAEYLCNLCRQVLADQQEELRKAARLWLAQQPARALRTDAEQLARQSGLAALLQLLTLCWFDLLPAGLQPERIERPLRLAARQLPPPLDQLCLAAANLLPPIPHGFAVVLTGLRHRLEQVQWRSDSERAARTLEWLLFSPSATPGPPAPGGLWLEPAAPSTSPLVAEASRCPATLLGRALWRQLRGQPQPPMHLGAPLELPPEALHQSVVVARFDAAGVPPTREQQTPLLARLRLAWPHRRLAWPAATPAWLFDLAALFGHSLAGARLQLTLPGDWLRQPGGAELLELLVEQGSVQQLGLAADGRCRLQLERTRLPGTEVRLTTAGGDSISFPWDEVGRWPATSLDLVLRLPAKLLSRLSDGRLGFGTIDPSAPGLELYLRSTLAQHLLTLLSADDLPPGLPLPSADILRGLAGDCAGSEIPAPEAIDAALYAWLDLDGLPDLPEPVRDRAPLPAVDAAQVEEALAQLLREEGRPSFPEPYYYRLPVGELRAYGFTPPLRRTGEFFGQVELADAAGQRLRADSPELARALELAAKPGNNSVRLPEDPTLLRQLLDAYRTDLERLRHRLEQRALALCRDSRQARRLVERLWRREGMSTAGELDP